MPTLRAPCGVRLEVDLDEVAVPHYAVTGWSMSVGRGEILISKPGNFPNGTRSLHSSAADPVAARVGCGFIDSAIN